MSGIQERLKEIHRRVIPMVAPTRPNPYEPGNLIWVSTPPLERAAKLFPEWIGLFRVLRVSNPHHVVYASSAGMFKC